MEGEFLHEVAGAALPIGLLLVAAGGGARAVLWAGAGDEQLRRSARRAVAPLCMAALVVAGIDLMAVILAGSPSAAALAAPLAIIALACVLGGSAGDSLARGHDTVETAAAAPPPPPPPAPAAARPSPPPAAARGASLWADSPPPADDRSGLWSRP